MKCPKCSAENVERSGKTWVCYACMHIWMDKPAAKMSGPQCSCSKPASYYFLADGAWSLLCKQCLLSLHPHLSEKDRQSTTFKLVPNTFNNLYNELLTEE